MMLKSKKTSATEIPQNALSHNEGKFISKFEYFYILLSRAGGMFGTTLTGSLAAAFLHELYYGPVGFIPMKSQAFLLFKQHLQQFAVFSLA